MKRSIFISFLLCLISLFSMVSVTPALQAQELQRTPEANEWWKAGFARTVITPYENIWMAGYSARDKPADGKLHDLWAKAMVLEDAYGSRVLLITTDLIGFGRDLSVSICDRLVREYQVERRNIILSSSHTHSGPVINNNLKGIYPPFNETLEKQIVNNQSFVEDQIVIVAGRAISNLAPARVSSGVGIARFAVNRRENPWDDESLYSPDLNGPSDHAVQVLTVTDPSDKPIAVVFGYSCHATTLDINKWSGDYPGFAQIELEQEYPGLTAMFFAGFGADQNPLPRREISLAEQYGKELAIAVERVMEEPMKILSPAIQTEYNEIGLALSAPPSVDELEKVMEEGDDWMKRWAESIKEKLVSGNEFPGSYPNYPVQSWQLGEQTLVVMGGEVVVDYAFALRDTLGNDLMLMGYANDVMAYIPSERVLKEGAYEGETSMWVYGHHGTWVSGIEEKIVREVIRQVTKVRNEH